MPDNASDTNTQDTYIRSRQSTRNSDQFGSIEDVMNQYLANERGDSLAFNEDNFIRSGRRGRRTARDNEDELMIAGGLGTET